MQTYVRRPTPLKVEACFSTGKKSRIAKLIAGDVLALQQFNEGEPVGINQQYGAKRAGCSLQTFSTALKELQRAGILIQTQNHSKGHHSKGYNIPTEVLEEGFTWKTYHVSQPHPLKTPGHLVTQDTEAQRIHFRNIRTDRYFPAIDFLKRKENSGLLQVTDWRQFYEHKTALQLAEAMTDISALKIIDPKGANAHALLFELSFRFMQLHELSTGSADHMIFMHDQTQRIYSTITQIPREFRKSLRYHYTGGNYTRNLRPAEIAPYNGCSFFEVDVKNCQPLLLAALLKQQGINAHRLLQDTQEGTFHDAMMEATGHADKDAYKPRLFHFLYGRPNDPTRAEFTNAFGDLYGKKATQFIEDHKRRNGHKALPILLQRMESAAMIYKAARRVRHLHPSAPVFSVHDCLLIPERPDIVQDTIKATKRAFFDLYGINVRTSEPKDTASQNEG